MGCVQKMSQMILISDGPDVTGRAYAALEEADAAANRSCNKIRGLLKASDYAGSKAGSSLWASQQWREYSLVRPMQGKGQGWNTLWDNQK